MVTMAENRARLALHLCPGLGRKGFIELVQRAGSAEAVIASGKTQWQAWGLTSQVQQGLQNLLWQQVDVQLEWQMRQPDQHHLLWWDMADYPKQLAHIDDFPPLLWVRGSLAVLAEPQVAIVGSRNATTGGNKIAFDFAQGLATSGVAITSGLAGGIDAAAHAGALAAEDGQTIAVVGTGVDLVYPARNKLLAEAILNKGAIVSEFPLGSRANTWHFPQRNRIISGIALGVLVVEAADASGSLITARLALEQGKEVFAIPGSIHNPLSKGCHSLIKKGQAKLTETVQDVLTELAPQLHAYLQAESPRNDAAPVALSEAAAKLLAQIPYDPIHADNLIQQLQIHAADFASLLMELEISDSVEIYGGNKVARIR